MYFYEIIMGESWWNEKRVVLEWRTEPPMEEGFYWVLDGERVRLGEVFRASEKTWMVDFTDEEPPRIVEAFVYWMGALPFPDLPDMVKSET